MRGRNMSRCDEIRIFLTESGLLGGTADVSDEESLLLSGIIDSLAILELTTFIEQKYSLRIDSTELVPENFDSLAAISSFIDRKRPEGA